MAQPYFICDRDDYSNQILAITQIAGSSITYKEAIKLIEETNTFTCNCPWSKFLVIQQEDKKDEGDEDGEERE